MPQDSSAYYSPDARAKITRDYENAMKEDRDLMTKRATEVGRAKRDRTVTKSARSNSKARSKRAQARGK
jgi:hypothetical protein